MADKQYQIQYTHDDCPVQPGVTWEDTYDCAVNGECPACGATDIVPASYAEIVAAAQPPQTLPDPDPINLDELRAMTDGSFTTSYGELLFKFEKHYSVHVVGEQSFHGRQLLVDTWFEVPYRYLDTPPQGWRWGRAAGTANAALRDRATGFDLRTVFPKPAGYYTDAERREMWERQQAMPTLKRSHLTEFWRVITDAWQSYQAAHPEFRQAALRRRLLERRDYFQHRLSGLDTLAQAYQQRLDVLAKWISEAEPAVDWEQIRTDNLF